MAINQSDLPTSWVMASLGDVASKPQYGWTTKAAADGENLKLLRTSDISSGRVNWTTVPTCVDEPSVPEKYFLDPGDIVVARAGSVGKSFLISERVTDAVFASYLVRFRPQIRPEYIDFFMQSRLYWEQIEDKSSGIAIPNVNASKLAAVTLPVAPRDEQDRIVEKIETLFAELDKGEEALREVQKLLARYRQSVLKAAVTGTLTADWRAANGQGEWQETTLGELNSLLTSGSRGWAKFYADEGDTFIRAQNLKFDRLDLNDVAFVALPDRSEGTRTRVLRGDILITITGANVTKTALVERVDGVTYVSQHVALFRPTNDVHPEFLHRFIIAKAGGRMALEKAAYGAGKPGLNLQNIKDVPISLPPIEEQREIVDRLDHLLGAQSSIQTEIERQLARGQSLRQSILKDAFSGKLVPQDPSEEPADKLLERIRAAREEKPKAKRKKTKA